MTEGTDDRLKRDLGVNRRSRAADERTLTEDRVLTDADRLEMFRLQSFNDALPDIPPIPGYHVCWLTTTNPRDPIQRRLRIGYELIRAEDVPGMEHSTLKTGEYVGCVGVNEMIAAKLPESLYQAFMKEAHHDAPRQEEEALNAKTDRMRADMEDAGANVIEEEGFQDLRHIVRAPERFL